MKKLLTIGLMVAILSLGTGLAIPVFAHGPTDGDSAPVEQDLWQAMHEACEEGDWEAMAEAAEEFHEENGHTACHGSYATEEEGWGGHMGGGMMDRGWGGMMGWQ